MIIKSLISNIKTLGSGERLSVLKELVGFDYNDLTDAQKDELKETAIKLACVAMQYYATNKVKK